MTSATLERFHHYLRQHGRSRTAARDQVFLALHYQGRCRTPDLRRRLKAEPLDRVTLYRTIRFLIDIGAAQEFTNGTIELTDYFKQHHHHLLCTNCGLEASFHHASLESALSRIAATRGFWVSEHTVELSGLCSNCAAVAGKTGTGIEAGRLFRAPQ